MSLARLFKVGSTNAYPYSVAAATVDTDDRYQPSLRDSNNYVTALPALKSRARLKCRSAAGESPQRRKCPSHAKIRVMTSREGGRGHIDYVLPRQDYRGASPLCQTLNLHEDSIIALQVAIIGVANRDDARAEAEVCAAGRVGEFIAHQ